MGIDVQEYRNKFGRAPGFTLRVKNLDQVLEGLDNLAADVQKATRPAASAAAKVLYDEVKKNAQLFGEGYVADGTGKLADAVYRVYSRAGSDAMRATYHVSWNQTKAPHGHLVEFGHWQPYVTYRGKDGKFHTAVRPSMLKQYLATYNGKTVPKHLRDKFFVKRPSPKWIPARPFVRAAQSQFDAATSAAAEVIYRAVDGQQRLAL